MDIGRRAARSTVDRRVAFLDRLRAMG